MPETKTGIPTDAELEEIARFSCFRTLIEAISALTRVRDRTAAAKDARIQEIETQLAEARKLNEFFRDSVGDGGLYE